MTKPQGAVLTLIITTVMVYLYYGIFGFMLKSQFTVLLTFCFFLAVLFSFVRENAYGGELRFFGQLTGVRWESGYCLVPSILPILHHIRIYLGYDLEEDPVERSVEYRNPRIHHFQDQRLSNYNVRADTTLLGLNTDKFLGWLINWITGIHNGPKKLFYQRVGFRLMVLCILMGFVTSFTHPREKDTTKDVSIFTRLKEAISFGELKQTAREPRVSPSLKKEVLGIAQILYVDPALKLAVYRPFRNECVYILPQEIVLIDMAIRISDSDFALTDEVLLLNDPVGPKWERVTWGVVRSSTSHIDKVFSSLITLKVENKSTTLSQTKKVCF